MQLENISILTVLTMHKGTLRKVGYVYINDDGSVDATYKDELGHYRFVKNGTVVRKFETADEAYKAVIKSWKGSVNG